MKTELEKYRLKCTLKNANIPIGRPFGNSGLCPKNPQGTSPLTHFRALPEPVLVGKQEKGAVVPFLYNRMIREPYVKRLSRHIFTLCVPVFHGSLDNGSALFMRLSAFGDLKLFAGQGRLTVAIFLAYCPRLPASLLC